MYTLYYLPGACSLATQVVLHELNQDVTIVNKNSVEDFNEINPANVVPVLSDGENIYREGAAIMLHLLNSHENTMFPKEGLEKERAIQDLMFANASMHPAYGRLFFIANNLDDGEVKQQAFDAAVSAINHLWQVVESLLSDQLFLAGKQPGVADIYLSVYARWGEFFPVNIQVGPRTQAMFDAIYQRDSFKRALANEAEQAEAA